MSKSFKHTPYSGLKKSKFFKTYANRKLRRNKLEKYNNRKYKRVFQSWNICDYYDISNFDIFVRKRQRYQNKKLNEKEVDQLYEEYKKIYIRK